LKDYDVIIVGGGVAGLTCAAYLCKKGYQTLLCEKSGNTGGLVKTFWHKDFAFDAGIRAFENSGILFPMIKSLGLDLSFVKNTVSIGIGNQWTRLNNRDSLNSYFSMLRSLFPENSADIHLIENEVGTVIDYMDVLYGIENPLFIEKPDMEYLTKTLLPWLLKYQINIRKASRLSEPVRSYLHRFTRNEALIDMLIQHFFSETPTFFALSYFGQYYDYSYPLGGTGVLADKLTQYVMASGGSVLTLTAVTGIDERQREIITDQGQSFCYKKLVWAADQKLLYNALTPGRNKAAERQRVLINRSHGCDSVLTVFMGIDLDAQNFHDLFGPHAFYTPSSDGLSSLPDWHKVAGGGKDALLVWLAAYLDRTSYEISCPSLRDPSLAPVGKIGVTVSTLMDVELIRLFSETGAYDYFKQYCTEKITLMLEAIIPGLNKKTEFTLCATPLTIEHETGNTDGAITGWAFTNSPIPAENRFKKITRSTRTPMTDIFQCGQWTFSPSGLPISILTGKLAANAVHKNMRKR
jgi:phytoene dehydrogenase-like protein